MKILLSIRPNYAHEIMLGRKTVEFRRTPIKKPVKKAVIYVSRSHKKVMATANIKYIISMSPKELWKEYKDIGGISKNDFFEYFKDKDIGYAIIFGNVKILNEKEQYKPDYIPQSFCYI